MTPLSRRCFLAAAAAPGIAPALVDGTRADSRVTDTRRTSVGPPGLLVDWSVTVDIDGKAKALAVEPDGSGGYYVAGQTEDADDTTDVFVLGLNGDGTERFRRRFTEGEVGYFDGMVVQGGTLLVARSYLTDATDVGPVLTTIGTDGTVQSEWREPGGARFSTESLDWTGAEYRLAEQDAVTAIRPDGTVSWRTEVTASRSGSSDSSVQSVTHVDSTTFVLGDVTIDDSGRDVVWTAILGDDGQLLSRSFHDELPWYDCAGVVPTGERTLLAVGTSTGASTASVATFDPDGTLRSGPVQGGETTRPLDVQAGDGRYRVVGIRGSMELAADGATVEQWNYGGLWAVEGIASAGPPFDRHVVAGEDYSDNATVVAYAPNEPPTASFTVSTTQPTVGDPVSFSPSSSADPNDNIEAYRWNFDGNGEYDTEFTDPEHTYPEVGTYEPTLTVVDELGETDTASATIAVQPEPTSTQTPTAAPTATDTAADTATPTDDGTDSPDDGSSVPGFGALATLGSLLGAGALARRWNGDD